MANENYRRVVFSLADMKQELEECISQEDYEEAAQVCV